MLCPCEKTCLQYFPTVLHTQLYFSFPFHKNKYILVFINVYFTLLHLQMINVFFEYIGCVFLF